MLLLAAVIHAQTSKPAPPAAERDAAKQNAIEIATKVPKEMGLLGRTEYLIIPIDRFEEAGTLQDSDIGPYLPPVVLSVDWITVLFVPKKLDAGPTVAVYVDSKLRVVRGYLVGPKRELK